MICLPLEISSWFFCDGWMFQLSLGQCISFKHANYDNHQILLLGIESNPSRIINQSFPPMGENEGIIGGTMPGTATMEDLPPSTPPQEWTAADDPSHVTGMAATDKVYQIHILPGMHIPPLSVRHLAHGSDDDSRKYHIPPCTQRNQISELYGPTFMPSS